MNMHERALMAPGALDAYQSASGSDHPDFLRVLRRHARLLAITVAIIMTAAAIAMMFIEPRYQATTQVQVDIDELPIADPETPGTPIREVEQLRTHQIETQIRLIQSRPVARETVRNLALYDDLEFNPAADPDKMAQREGPITRFGRWLGVVAPLKAPDPADRFRAASPQVVERATDRLVEATEVAQDGQSSFIDVSVTSVSAAKAARIANKLAANYLAMQIKERRASRERTVRVLTQRVEELRRQLLSIEWSAAAYRRAHRIDAGPGNDANVAQMGRLASELAGAASARAEADARSGSGAQMMSPLLSDLRGQQTVVERRLAELQTLYGSAHPDVQKANAELTQIRSDIGAERGRVAQQLANESYAQRNREARMAGELNAMRAQSLDRGMASVPLGDLERSAEAGRTSYSGLLQRLQEARRQLDTVRADASIASTALVPTQSSFPRATHVFGAAAVASIVFGLLFVLIAEGLENQVRTASDAAKITTLPTLGMIPEVTSRRQKWLAHVAVANEPYTVFAEAVRRVTGKLLRELPGGTGRTVLVTSPLPGDGKTTVAIGLAAAAVATGRRAVVLDLDLRAPGLPDVLRGANQERDLHDYLDGSASLDDILVPCQSLPALQMIFVRRSVDDPGAAIAAPAMDTLFEQLRDRFDLIVVNTPPVLAVSDAQALGPRCDAVLMVLRWGHTTPDLLRAAVAQFDGDITGLVFNRVHFARHARMAYGDSVQHYRKFSRYYQQERLGLLDRRRWQQPHA